MKRSKNVVNLHCMSFLIFVNYFLFNIIKFLHLKIIFIPFLNISNFNSKIYRCFPASSCWLPFLCIVQSLFFLKRVARRLGSLAALRCTLCLLDVLRFYFRMMHPVSPFWHSLPLWSFSWCYIDAVPSLGRGCCRYGLGKITATFVSLYFSLFILFMHSQISKC